MNCRSAKSKVIRFTRERIYGLSKSINNTFEITETIVGLLLGKLLLQATTLFTDLLVTQLLMTLLTKYFIGVAVTLVRNKSFYRLSN